MPLQSKEDLIADLQSKKFRDAFVSSRVSNTLALQIRAMRQERGWSQAYLAELLGTSQNAVYRLESPQYGKPSITTLKRLASIFDVGLSVWFSPFSKLVDRVTNLSTDDILVPSFDNDLGLQERIAPSAQTQTTIALVRNSLLTVSLEPSADTDANQPIITSDSSTAVLRKNNITVIGVDKYALEPKQNAFIADVVKVTLDNTASLSGHILVVNREGKMNDARTYPGKSVATAA
jgi:transcriptional regulator with XRE-family HTH domain